MTDRIFKAAIVGCGSIHKKHAGVIGTLSNVELAVVCDIKPERADASAQKYGARAVYSFEEVLADPAIDAVHLCTPHYLHASQALAALNAGKYVLVEKPLAVTDEEALQLIEASDKSGGKLCVVFQNRYLPAAKALHEAISGGSYGELITIRGTVTWNRNEKYYSDDWHGRKALECGGVLINQAIHTLDMMQWVTGRNVKSVAGSCTTDALTGIIEVEDSAHIRLEFDDGLVGLFYATNGYGAMAPVEIEARLTGGTLIYRNGYLYRWDDGQLPQLLVSAQQEASGEKAYWGVGHELQIKDFYECIAAGAPFTLDAREGYKALRTVLALYRASETQQKQYI